MKINELIVEQQLDELGVGWQTAKQGLKQIGQGAAQVGKGAVQGAPGALGGVAKGVGAVAGGIAGAWNAAKQGYQAGKAAVSGSPQSGAGSSTLGAQAPQTSGGTPNATTQPITPQQAQQQQVQAAQQAKIGVGQINKIIPTLRSRDIDSIKKQLDLRQQALKKTNPTGAQQPTGIQTTTGTVPPAGQPNLQVQQGGQQATAESKEFYSNFLGRSL